MRFERLTWEVEAQLPPRGNGVSVDFRGDENPSAKRLHDLLFHAIPYRLQNCHLGDGALIVYYHFENYVFTARRFGNLSVKYGGIRSEDRKGALNLMVKDRKACWGGIHAPTRKWHQSPAFIVA